MSLYFDKFRYVFGLGLKSILYLFQRQILGFMGNENDFPHVYEVSNCKNLNLLYVDKIFVHFLGSLL